MLQLVEETNELIKQVVENQRKISEYFRLGTDFDMKQSTDSIDEPKDSVSSISEKTVSEFIIKLGMPTHIRGYRFVISAIMMTLENFSVIDRVTKEIYPAVAKEHGTTSSRVERGIRHAIEVTCDRGNIELLNDLFGYTIDVNKGKPTNSEFIAMIATKLTYKN